jgi:outer membrane receptor protein involved in Fe transport
MFDYRAGLRVGLTSAINLDLSGSYGESENQQTLQGYILTSRVRTALYTTSASSCNLGNSPQVITPVNGLPSTLAASGAGTTGCVPLNIFGADGSITPAMLSYLTANSTTTQRSALAQARALVSGDFGASVPWANDPVAFAVGAEHRTYKARQIADVLSQTSGELGGAGGAVPNFRGAYDVSEVYGELIAPLVQDRPFFHSLTLETGIRYSHYKVEAPGNPTYNTTTWKAAATWEPVVGLRLRGNYQRAVRAPNINELFAPTNVGLTNLTTDPCRTTRVNGNITYAGPLTNANLQAVCLMQGAPSASIGNIPNPTAAQANSTTAGGTYIRPEKADSYTVGAVFQPDFVPGLSITVDYYHIRIKNAISQPTPNDVVNNCFGDANASGITAQSINNPLCKFFRRNPGTGDLSGDPATVGGLVFALSNSGRILTDGIDVGLNYRRDIGFAKLNLSLNGNWTHRSLFQAIVPGSVIPPGYPGAGTTVPASAPRECVGLYSPNCGSPGSAGPNSAAGSMQPEFSWNQRTTFSFDKVDVSLLWRHISKMRAETGFVTFKGTIASGVLAGKSVDFGHIPAYDWFDLATRFDVSDNLDLTITVQNLLDKHPPIVGSTIGSASFNSGNTYPSTYDSLGRRFAISARLKF